jgi:hypothetical protein
MIISTVVALVGSVTAFALVRERDFVPSYTPAADATPAAGMAGEGGDGTGVPATA